MKFDSTKGIDCPECGKVAYLDTWTTQDSRGLIEYHFACKTESCTVIEINVRVFEKVLAD